MTGFHEIFQSAPQIAHQAKELIDLEMRSNLLQKLVESGHPYGLLLSQSNASSANGAPKRLISSFFPREKGYTKASLKGNVENKNLPLIGSSVLSFPPLAIPFTGASWMPLLFAASIPGSIIGSIHHLSLEDKENQVKGSVINNRFLNLLHGLSDKGGKGGSKAEGSSFIALLGSFGSDPTDLESISTNDDYSNGLALTLSSKGSILGSAKHNPDIARKLHLEQVFAQQAFLAPIWLKLFAGENALQERKRELVVDQSGVGLGTAAVKLATFRGQEPYVIKTPKGEGVAQINPGDPIGHIHLSHQASLIRQLSPMEKVSVMTEDLLGLFSAIDQPTEGELKLQQQEVLVRAKEATVIGISHLVRLFSRKTGLPTWKLDILPELVQRFHQHDSQAVSKAFGGSRKVRPADVEMMVITPKMRQQLVANYA